MIGSVLDRRYRLDARLAEGGYGVVYRATHVKSGHQVAIKVLHRELAQDLGVVARFRREAATLTSLRSPHTVAAYELGELPDRTLFMVMELLAGESLYEHYAAHGPLPWRRVVAIAHAVCASLGEAHALGIVHRDLKPANIHLSQQAGGEVVKVLDFGIAKILGGGDLTNAGEMVGSLDYMAPEQMVGGEVTGQCDLYTLGIVMYEMIAGRLPFGEAKSAAGAMAAIMRSTPAPLAIVPPELDRLVLRCLEREPARRFADVNELRAALDALGDQLEPAGVRAAEHADAPTVAAGGSPARAPRAPTPLPLPPPRLTPLTPTPVVVQRPITAPPSPPPPSAFAPSPAPPFAPAPTHASPPSSVTIRRGVLILVLGLAALAGALLAGLTR